MTEAVATTPLWPWLKEPLAAAIQQLATHHAVLLHGAQGIGQFEFAMHLARSWLCEGHPTTQGAGIACGRCPSCHLIDAGSHPDLMVILPEALQAALGWGAASAEVSEKAEKSEAKSKKLSNEIKVESVRAVVQFSQHTTSRGRAKVIVLHPAERMNLIAANTLLKTLEEPPGQVRFVLSGATLDELLPTIRSRCQAWQLPVPDTDSAAQWLAEQMDKPSLKDAQVILAAAGGQPLTARDHIQLGLDASAWLSLPKAVQQGQPTPLTQWPLPLVVDALQKLCHDLARMSVGSEPRYFPAAALPTPPELNLLTTWSQELRKLSRHAEHPWNQNLKIETLLLQARAILRVRANGKARAA